MIDSILKVVQGWVKIKGGTDGTMTGNVGDRLKVDASLSYSPSSPLLDAFQRNRVSEPRNLFDASFYYGLQTSVFDSTVANSATITHNNNKKVAILSTANVANSSVIMQSFYRMKYHAARSNMIVISGNFGTGVSGVTKRIGQFDASNGYFLEITSAGVYFVIRSKVSGVVVDNKILQANWNLNTLAALNISKQNILFIDYQWLGSGTCRFGFVIDGQIIYCHAFHHANILSTLYSQTATLPVRGEVAGQGVASMEIACMAVVSEGNDTPDGILRTVYTGTTPRTISGTTANFPLLSFRKKTANFDVIAILKSINVFMGSSDDILLKLIKNPALTAASWVNAGGFCEFDKSATSYTGGFEIVSSYLRGSSTSESASRLTDVFNNAMNANIGSYINGASEIMTISISNITSSTSVHGSINYKEII
jgi:hypothetical protein